MWWHADNSKYGLLLQGHAVSPNISGPYTFVDATAPLGNWSQDFGLFNDYKDGRSYALYSNGDSVDGRDVYIASMNDNLTSLEDVVYRFPKFDLEAPTIMQTEKSYWALMSHKTGYRPNSECAQPEKESFPNLVSRRGGIPCRLAEGSVVSTIHRVASQHKNFQLAIRLHTQNRRKQKDHLSLHWRSVGLKLCLGQSLHMASNQDRRKCQDTGVGMA